MNNEKDNQTEHGIAVSPQITKKGIAFYGNNNLNLDTIDMIDELIMEKFNHDKELSRKVMSFILGELTYVVNITDIKTEYICGTDKITDS